MSPNLNQPQNYDAVIAGQCPPPSGSMVLGGLEGVRRRLALTEVESKIDALLDAFEYGQEGLDLVIQALKDKSEAMKEAACLLLQEITEPRVKQALQEYKQNKLDSLRNQIEVAFADVPYPGDDEVAVEMDLDFARAGEYFRGKTWRGHSARNLRRFQYALTY